MRVNGFKLLQEDTLYFYFFYVQCIERVRCSMSIAAIKRQCRCCRQYSFYLLFILKAFIIVNTYQFYFRHDSFLFDGLDMSEDHYLKFPYVINCSVQISSVENCVYTSSMYACMFALTLEKKEEMKLYVTRNLDEYVYMCV